jgi:hypothetical protein
LLKPCEEKGVPARHRFFLSRKSLVKKQQLHLFAYILSLADTQQNRWCEEREAIASIRRKLSYITFQTQTASAAASSVPQDA